MQFCRVRCRRYQQRFQTLGSYNYIRNSDNLLHMSVETRILDDLGFVKKVGRINNIKMVALTNMCKQFC